MSKDPSQDSNDQAFNFNQFDNSQWQENWMNIAAKTTELVQEFMQGQLDKTQETAGGMQSPTGQGAAVEANPMGHADPLNVFQSFQQLGQKMLEDPQSMMQYQAKFFEGQAQLWQTNMQRMMGGADTSAEQDQAKSPSMDKRFKDEEWQSNPVFSYIKDSYLLTANWMSETIEEYADELEPNDQRKVNFYTQQLMDAVSPTNFALTNPTVLRETLDSNGENLVRGLENILNDIKGGKGQLRISMTDKDAFKVGENIATSKGKVIYRNDLMELIHFEPSCKTIKQVPLLIIPPWINKFYILDLKAKNSFIKWTVDQGVDVFIISWVNPDESYRDKGFEDYIKEGILAGVKAVQEATNEPKVNAIGYCIGGTLLATTLAHLADKKKSPIQSATFFTTLVDFSEPGDLSIFIDEEQVEKLEEKMSQRGYLEGSEMATSFNMLRANDLIWSFVINNYLMGKAPFPFDLLYWNSDSTRMPYKMHSYYLRKMYLENKLVEKNGLNLMGSDIDLTKIKTPVFILSTHDDHIAPWKSTYAATQIYSGPIRFTLSESGHIAGVVNPPIGGKKDAGKYGHWSNNALPADPNEWLEQAKFHESSWWVEWREWLEQHSGKDVPARTPGSGALKAITDAPGEYVKIRFQE